MREWFAALSEGGQVAQPLTPAPWGDEFGMFVDRFGISWLVNIAGEGQPG
jgi:PhnB protein